MSALGALFGASLGLLAAGVVGGVIAPGATGWPVAAIGLVAIIAGGLIGARLRW